MNKHIIFFLGITLAAGLSSGAIEPAYNPAAEIEATRATLSKWMETQQVISKERREWQQGREILQARLELIKNEVAGLQQKIKQTESTVAEADQRRAALQAENDQVKATAAQLAETVAEFEAKIRELNPRLTEPLRTKLQPLYQRIPEDPKKTRVSVAERYQNVLGILNELNKANNEINVVFEVRNLADGKPAEVRTMYVGLAQAYFFSSKGEAGIGRPGAAGWEWQSANDQARNIELALEILANKHTPAFVPLPVKIQ
jgi:hypothetical protein